jgi:cell division initiation protein
MAERERMLQETLTTTQRLTEEMKGAAKREAQLVVRDAELQAEKLLEEARGEEARLRSHIHAVKRLRRELTEDLRSTLERYQRVLTADLESPDWGAEPDGPAKG